MLRTYQPAGFQVPVIVIFLSDHYMEKMMSRDALSQSSISSDELLSSVIPKLQAVENAVKAATLNKLSFLQDETEKSRLTEMRAEIEIEIMMIRLNLQHLMSRHPELVDTNGVAVGRSIMLTLSDDEQHALDRAKKLYQKAVLDR
jgi:hypothetical protein